MIHIVRASKGQRRTSFGVSFDLLAIGPASMTTLMHYRIGNVIPFHAHPNEQAGYILSGRVRVLTRDSGSDLGPGDSYTIPADMSTALRSLKTLRSCKSSLPQGLSFSNKMSPKQNRPNQRASVS